VLLVHLALAAEDRPLPDRDVFLAEARKHLQADYSLQSHYMYVETRHELTFDREGRATSESVKVFENYPGLPGEGRWERLVARDGKPVPAEELARQDRERRERAERLARRLANEPAREHARQVREWEEQRRDWAERVEDIFRVFEIDMRGREVVEGHDTIAFTLTPRRDARPRTRDGDLMRHFRVRAWVSESDYELVRLEAEAIETVAVGFGLVARMHKGARLSFLRRKINGEVWLPAESSYSGRARVGLVRTIRRGGRSEFSDYRKFAVDASMTVQALASD
jgi:hypothetical protein